MIKLDHDYYIVELNCLHIPDEVFDWLHENLGTGDNRRYWIKHPKIYFENKYDNLMFTIAFA